VHVPAAAVGDPGGGHEVEQWPDGTGRRYSIVRFFVTEKRPWLHGTDQSLTAAIRRLGLRPSCHACHAARGRDMAVIEHPPGAETQFDWVELPDPPAGWD
jgi:hypothetical protein